MWIQSNSIFVSDLKVEELWAVWADINHWHIWQEDVEYAELEDSFASGHTFLFKPKGAPKMTLQLLDVIAPHCFTDMTQFPLAQMYGKHEFIEHANGEIEIKITMSIKGALSWLWRKMVAESIVKDLPKQSQALVQRARELRTNSNAYQSSLPTQTS